MTTKEKERERGGKEREIEGGEGESKVSANLILSK